MSTTPNVPYRLEFSVEVPGTPEQVWQAIATAKGMSAWFLPTEMEEREGGSLHISMGPEMGSDGRITGWDPPRRIAYEEDWAALMGKDPEALSPLTSEFLVEAQSGGTCIVRVTSSGFGTGAAWESEFWDDMGLELDAVLRQPAPLPVALPRPGGHAARGRPLPIPATRRRSGRPCTTRSGWATRARRSTSAAPPARSSGSARGRRLIRLHCAGARDAQRLRARRGQRQGDGGRTGVPVLGRRGGLRTARGAGLAGLAAGALHPGLNRCAEPPPRPGALGPMTPQPHRCNVT